MSLKDRMNQSDSMTRKEAIRSVMANSPKKIEEKFFQSLVENGDTFDISKIHGRSAKKSAWNYNEFVNSALLSQKKSDKSLESVSSIRTQAGSTLENSFGIGMAVAGVIQQNPSLSRRNMLKFGALAGTAAALGGCGGGGGGGGGETIDINESQLIDKKVKVKSYTSIEARVDVPTGYGFQFLVDGKIHQTGKGVDGTETVAADGLASGDHTAILRTINPDGSHSDLKFENIFLETPAQNPPVIENKKDLVEDMDLNGNNFTNKNTLKTQMEIKGPPGQIYNWEVVNEVGGKARIILSGKVDGGGKVSMSGRSKKGVIASGSSTPGIVDITLADLTDGQYNLAFITSIPGSDYKQRTEMGRVMINTIAPDIKPTKEFNLLTNSTENNGAFAIKVPEVSGEEIAWQAFDGSSVIGSGKITYEDGDKDGNFFQDLNLKNLAAGTHNIKIVAYDKSGNKTEVFFKPFEVVTTAPTIEILEKEEGVLNKEYLAGQNNKLKYQFRVDGSSEQFHIFNGDNIIYSTTENGIVDVEFNKLPDGTYNNLRARSLDSLGQIKFRDLPAITIDTGAPEPTINNQASGLISTNTPAYDIDFAADTVSWEISDGTTIYKSGNNADSFDGTLPVMPDGAYNNLRLITRDEHGNTHLVNLESITIDTGMPEISIASNFPASTSNQTLSATINVESGINWQIINKANADEVLASGVGTGVNDAITTKVMADGHYNNIYLVAEEASGNKSQEKMESVTIDTTVSGEIKKDLPSYYNEDNGDLIVEVDGIETTKISNYTDDIEVYQGGLLVGFATDLTPEGLANIEIRNNGAKTTSHAAGDLEIRIKETRDDNTTAEKIIPLGAMSVDIHTPTIADTNPENNQINGGNADQKMESKLQTHAGESTVNISDLKVENFVLNAEEFGTSQVIADGIDSIDTSRLAAEGIIIFKIKDGVLAGKSAAEIKNTAEIKDEAQNTLPANTIFAAQNVI